MKNDIVKFYTQLDAIAAKASIAAGYPDDAQHGCGIKFLDERDNVFYTRCDGFLDSAIYVNDEGKIVHLVDVNHTTFDKNNIADEYEPSIYDDWTHFCRDEKSLFIDSLPEAK